MKHDKKKQHETTCSSLNFKSFASLPYPFCHVYLFFPKQFTVGVLNATLDLAALVLVGVVGFLGSEVVLSPIVSGCLPSCGG